MNAPSFVYIDVVIICTMMSFYQQILHSFSCYNVLCIGNLTYAGHFAVCPSRVMQYPTSFHDVLRKILEYDIHVPLGN